MPVQTILIQPSANSLNAAYRPILLRVQATDSNNFPVPPVVYCDIYINGIFYRTISKSQPSTVNDTNSEWQFDVQDIQEVFERYLPPHGGFAIEKPIGLFAVVYCRFRSSYADDNNIIQPDTVIPVQATSSSVAQPGTGFQSNIFVVVNATLKQTDNQNLQQHLSFYKRGTWNSGAFPLTHRPDNYVVARYDSDFFPFIYTGNKTATCIALTLFKKDGTQQSFTYCEQPPPCTLVLNNILIVKAPDNVDGRTYYTAAFAVNDLPDHITIEVSIDNGSTWTDITNNAAFHVTGDAHSFTYNATSNGTAVTHRLRLTPFCDDTRAGSSAQAIYNIPTCPTITNLTVTYNPQTQIFTYTFVDPFNQPQSVTLMRNGAPYGVTYNDAPNTGNWTISNSGTFHVEVTTACSVGSAVTEISTSIDIVVSNALCNAPTSVVDSFLPDGNNVKATWTVADTTYADLVKWYDAATNNLLSMTLVSAGVFQATLNVSNYSSVQSFYATVQHQCPSPSVLGVGNTITRDNNFLLTIDLGTPGSIYVDCTRYGQPAPAPFTANILVEITYQIGGGGSNFTTQATNSIIYGNTTAYIYGSGDVIIINAEILNVNPQTQGGYTYIH